jgi:hypothetical protein
MGRGLTKTKEGQKGYYPPSCSKAPSSKENLKDKI